MTKEEAYDALINPLVAQIIATCKEHKIPMLASFTLDLEEGLHCTTALLEDDWEPSEDILAAAKTILEPRSRQRAILTTKNGKGEVTAVTVFD